MIEITKDDVGRKVILRDGGIETIDGYSDSSQWPFQISNGETVGADGVCDVNFTEELPTDVIAFLDEAIADGNPPSDSPLRRHTITSPQKVLRTLPAVAEDRKMHPVMSGCIDYFPLALAAVARLSKAGNDQHNPGQPLHWARDKSSDHPDCIVRHLIERGTLDSDGQRHTAKAAWRALALLQEELEAEAGWSHNAIIA